MLQTAKRPTRKSAEPAWQIATLFSNQGVWDGDLVRKRAEYAKAGIPEYWIVDPQERRITVLTLKGKSYIVRSEHRSAGRASSAVLKGFEADVASVWAAGRIGRK